MPARVAQLLGVTSVQEAVAHAHLAAASAAALPLLHSTVSELFPCPRGRNGIALYPDEIQGEPMLVTSSVFGVLAFLGSGVQPESHEGRLAKNLDALLRPCHQQVLYSIAASVSAGNTHCNDARMRSAILRDVDLDVMLPHCCCTSCTWFQPTLSKLAVYLQMQRQSSRPWCQTLCWQRLLTWRI